MADRESIEKQIEEYQSQLADVEELLKASPDDDSLLSLKSDLVELLNITRESLAETGAGASNSLLNGVDNGQSSNAEGGNVFEKALEAAVETSVGLQSEGFSRKRSNEADTQTFSAVITDAAVAAEQSGVQMAASASVDEPQKKKPKKIKDFEVPAHLLPNEADTEAERNKKRRALKALKSKWREKKKEVESEKKQKSWQSFQKKKKINNKGSIFATNEGDAKVGVVSASGRQMTEFGERKRHKHS